MITTRTCVIGICLLLTACTAAPTLAPTRPPAPTSTASPFPLFTSSPINETTVGATSTPLPSNTSKPEPADIPPSPYFSEDLAYPIELIHYALSQNQPDLLAILVGEMGVQFVLKWPGDSRLPGYNNSGEIVQMFTGAIEPNSLVCLGVSLDSDIQPAKVTVYFAGVDLDWSQFGEADPPGNHVGFTLFLNQQKWELIHVLRVELPAHEYFLENLIPCSSPYTSPPFQSERLFSESELPPETVGLQITVQTFPSPGGDWIAELVTALQETEGNVTQRYTRLTVSSPEVSWLLQEHWSEPGLGDSGPAVFQWSSDGIFLFMYNSGVADGCGVVFNKDLWQVNLVPHQKSFDR